MSAHDLVLLNEKFRFLTYKMTKLSHTNKKFLKNQTFCHFRFTSFWC